MPERRRRGEGGRKEKKKITRRVRKAMGLKWPGWRRLSGTTRPDLQNYFEPYAEREYPSSMSSDKSRVPMEYGIRQWGHIEAMERALHDEKLAREIARSPMGRQEFIRAMFDALQDRALRAYEEEWRGLDKSAIDKLITRSGRAEERPGAHEANEFNAKKAADEAMNILEKGGSVTIADLGCGGGGTILPIIDRIPEEHRSRVNVALVDVMGNGLKLTRKELRKKGLAGRGQVTIVKENLGRIENNKKLREFFGDVDIVTSGAALHHVADAEPTFRGVEKLLKPGGAFIFWDWGHAAWKAPRLIIAPTDAQVEKYGRSYRKGGRTKHAEKGTAFVSRDKVRGVSEGWEPTELEGVREMLGTWIGLLHYPPEERRKFENWFDQQARKGAPVEFSEYLRRLEGASLDKGEGRSQIKYWEGHRPPELYHDALRKAGLLDEKAEPYTRYHKGNILGPDGKPYKTGNPLLYQVMVRKK